ncbi:MAG: zf-HC2 domain-containing protein, partial [Candidatus Fermentibacteria bacterium]
MNCPDFDTLMMLLDGELPSARMKEVSEHVRLCSRCRNLIDSQRKLETSWRDSFTAPKEDDFRSMEWIIYRRMNRRSRWKFFVPAAAGIIAVLLGVKLIMENQPFKGRISESSIDRQTDYESYVLHLEDTRDDSAASDGDGFESAETLSTEDTTRETAAEVSDDVAGSARYEAPHSAAEG